VAGGEAADQGCAVPPICFANRLPHAPLRGAFGGPDSRFAARSAGAVFDRKTMLKETENEHDEHHRVGLRCGG